MFLEVNVFENIPAEKWNKTNSIDLIKKKMLKLKDFLWFNDLMIRIKPNENICEIIYMSDDYLEEITEKPVCLKVIYGNEIFIINNLTRENIVKIDKGDLKNHKKLVCKITDVAILSSAKNGSIGIMIGIK